MKRSSKVLRIPASLTHELLGVHSDTSKVARIRGDQISAVEMAIALHHAESAIRRLQNPNDREKVLRGLQKII